MSWVPFTDDMPFHGQIMQLDASPVPLAEDDPVAPGSIVGLGLFCAKDLQERTAWSSRCRTDRYGMPAMAIHYTLTPAGPRGDRSCRQGDRAPRCKAIGEPLDQRPFTMPLGASLHYQGTMRMGETDDGSSVCSPDSEVWGVPGVYVAGNGVIPTATACNPTLTGVALAVRGARTIAHELASSA